MKKEIELKSPYILKYLSDIGWWIDGYCGYQIISYCETKKECLIQFKKYMNKLKKRKK